MTHPGPCSPVNSFAYDSFSTFKGLKIDSPCCCSPVAPRSADCIFKLAAPGKASVLKITPHVVAVHKSTGVAFHTAANSTPGLAAQLRSMQASGELPQLPGRLYPVHRLDTVTSGIVLFGTSPGAAGQLAAAFRAGRVHKYYVALSERKPVKKQGSIVGDMGRSRRGSWMLLRSTTNPAVTRFTSTSLAHVRPGLRLYVLKPLTGRTHQLRVAMKSLGAPVLGDPLYSAATEAAVWDRTYLHAAALRVPLPQLACAGTESPARVAEQWVNGLQWGCCDEAEDQRVMHQASRVIGAQEDAECGGDLLQVVCMPSSGRLFQDERVREALQLLLPHSLEEDHGTWFPDVKLLRSC